MFAKIKSRRGETIVEVMIAIIVLVIGILAAVRLLINSGIQNELSRERVVATNLAREGIEAVRNIRDTNWLRFAGEKRLCWNNADFDDSITCEDGNGDEIPDEAIADEQLYIAQFDTTNFRWELETKNDPLDLSDGIDTTDEEYRLRQLLITPPDEYGLYNHIAAAADVKDSIYFREIYIEYMNDTGTVLAGNESANVIRITSRVEWSDRGRANEVTLTAILTDHLGRKNHD